MSSLDQSFPREELPYEFTHHDNRQQLLVKLGRFPHAPGEVTSYGEQALWLSRFRFRNGQHLLWLRINQVIIPAHIQVYNRQLFCQL